MIPLVVIIPLPIDMLGKLATPAAQLIAAFAAVFGFLVTYRTYHRSERTRRADLLISLHARFFENDKYSRIRRILDYKEDPEYSRLSDSLEAGTHSPVADELYRYLNFFELVASLGALNNLSRGEILTLFDYDLRLIKGRPIVFEALASQGFEHLAHFLAPPDVKGIS